MFQQALGKLANDLSQPEEDLQEDDDQPPGPSVYRLVERTLNVSSSVAIPGLLVGLALFILQSLLADRVPFNPRHLGDEVTMASIGLVALTPLAGLMTAVYGFIRKREWYFVAVSLGLISIISISILT